MDECPCQRRGGVPREGGPARCSLVGHGTCCRAQPAAVTNTSAAHWAIGRRDMNFCGANPEILVKVAQLCPTLCDPMDCSPWSSPGQNTRMGSLSLLQGIFPTQGSDPGLPHCRWILYQLRHQGSPRILEWVPYPFSRGSPNPGNESGLLHCRQILHQLSYQKSPNYF